MRPRRQRVLVLASWYPTATAPIGGVFVRDQAQVLARQYDVAVLSMIPLSMAAGQIRRSRRAAVERVDAASGIVRQDAIIPAPRHWAPAYYAASLLGAQRAFNQLVFLWGMPDIIHAHVVVPGGWTAVNLGARYTIPVVLTEHSGPFSMHLDGSYHRARVSDTLRRCDQVLAVSPALAGDMLRFEDRIGVKVVGNVINTDFFRPGSEHAKTGLTRFLSVGLLTRQKGFEYLIRAARLLVDRGETALRLAIIGSGPDGGRLRDLVRRLDLENWCQFRSPTQRVDVVAAMQMCDVLVMPSLAETFGVVLGEAMACGKPVIATRCGGPKYVVTPDTGLLVEPGSAEALAGAMARMMSERPYNPQRIRASVEQRFGPEVFLREISAVYEQAWIGAGKHVYRQAR